MPFYKQIDEQTAAGQRTLERLLILREQLRKEIPEKTSERTLLLATWNIREFDSNAYGDRMPEALYYIAEIIAKFDLIAIQEVRANLQALHLVMRVLGSDWAFIFSDATEGQKGNGERMAFVYDTRKVQFGGLMGQLVLPPLKTKDENGKTVLVPVEQIARTPLMAGFNVGWTDFILTTVHILYGKGGANSSERVREINELMQSLKRKSEDPLEWSRNLIVLGDFNIFGPGDLTMKALTDSGFQIPPELQKLPSNVLQNKYYDQIAFRNRFDKFGNTGKAGVFNFFDSVFTEEDEAIYAESMGESYHFTGDKAPRQNKSLYYKTYWRTHQMSDHLPMWVELKVDYSNSYLENKKRKGLV